MAGQKNMKNLSSFKIIHSPQSFDHLTSQNCCKERPYYSEGEYAASQIRGRHLQIFMETYLFEIIKLCAVSYLHTWTALTGPPLEYIKGFIFGSKTFIHLSTALM